MPHLCERNACTGCTACMAACPQGCITMVRDGEGFLRPQIDTDRCVDCGLCEKVCPVLHMPSVSKAPQAYGAQNRDETVRGSSTSGGVFTLVADHVLRQGGLVFGAAYGDDLGVQHRVVDCREGLSALRGAKYSQSDPGTSFAEVKKALEQGRTVLFSGTPCQTAGLRAFLGGNDANLLLVDLVCHGVPSPAVWQRYLQQRSSGAGKDILPTEVNLRSKETGWSTYSVALAWNGEVCYTARNDQDPFIRAFVGDLCLRPSCYQCPFKGLGRSADLTLGDYWGVWDQVPSMNDNRGTSVVLLHTEKARKLWDEISAQMRTVPVDAEGSMAQNPAALKPARQDAEKRSAFMSRYKTEDFDSLVRELLPPPNPLMSLTRRCVGAARRLLRRVTEK